MSRTKPRLPSLLLPCLLAAAVLAVAACGSSESARPTSAPEPTAPPEPAAAEGAAIRHPDRTFTLDHLIAAGWKNSKQLDAEALPGAIEVWYGFHRMKDIEVRVYASHSDALQYGVEPAKEAAASTYVGDHFKGVKPNYGAYMILGNLVLLCELEMSDCDALVDDID